MTPMRRANHTVSRAKPPGKPQQIQCVQTRKTQENEQLYMPISQIRASTALIGGAGDRPYGRASAGKRAKTAVWTTIAQIMVLPLALLASPWPS